MAVPIPDRVDDLALIAQLADGEIHSMPALLHALGGTSRIRLARSLARMPSLGVAIEEIPRRGYRLHAPVELFDAARIRAALSAEQGAMLDSLEVLFEVDSTNTRLLASPPSPVDRAQVLLCEIQSAGRGRRGRTWTSSFGGSLAMSLGWNFREAARAAPALSLAVGVAIVRALDGLGAAGTHLKWPNDVWLGDRKIGGVLVEVKTETSGSAYAVIGIGLNLRLSSEDRRALENAGTRAAALADAYPPSAGRDLPVSRNALVAALLQELLRMLSEFQTAGFTPFRKEWLERDALGGRSAQAQGPEGTVDGIARGVDVDGALLLERGERLHRFVSGEVSLRLSGGDA
jgi:BirA family transcriptional regulator, biotin operon repressor / biotin---[acetyl-CoA-carboxylase] ligase